MRSLTRDEAWLLESGWNEGPEHPLTEDEEALARRLVARQLMESWIEPIGCPLHGSHDVTWYRTTRLGELALRIYRSLAPWSA
jgi:hypothetical protein